MMHPEFIAVDWGTTHRRRFTIAADGMVVARESDDRGILAVSDFPAEIATLRAAAGDMPLLLAGMVGSNRGWVEAPYVEAPASLAALAAALVSPLPGVQIVPGVVQRDPGRPDIMRGEEVQLFGARALGQLGDGLACHPGTHSKWIEVENGGIARFRTVMTGDLLAALKARSILSDILAHDPGLDDDFIAGVDHALDASDLTAELFGARARVVTGQMSAAAAASRISGLLIGSDVRTGLGRSRADVVTLVGSPGLNARFALALARAGRESISVDGETAFIAGARAIMAAQTTGARA
jgi:2-dehydro-3-deoxygalactonokinase